MSLLEKRQNECCRKTENYEVTDESAQQSCKVCKVCGCRHWVVHVDSVVAGLKGVSLGGQQQQQN